MEKINSVNWGIIGCGDVTEKKSGPAFNRIKHSSLIAVMRRDGAKARDYARRHHVPQWTTDPEELINNPHIDAVYIATPPASHAQYAIMAAEAGKHIYVEKPMALNYSQCKEMIHAAEQAGVSLFVAYYRRRVPYFVKIKELVDSGAVGTVRFVNIRLFKPPRKNIGSSDQLPWRVRPEISGGGLFVDLGSHQLDFLDYLFGPIQSVGASVSNQAGLYPAEDIVCADFRFQSGVLGTGTWCFTVPEFNRTDTIDIIGSRGMVSFSTFDFSPIMVQTEKGIEHFDYPKPAHVQEPLIQTVVDELLGKGKCPSTGVTAARTSKIMDKILESRKEIDV